MKYYKVLLDNHSCISNDMDWTKYLPKDGNPGKWTRNIKRLKLCNSGYHLTDATHLIDWICGNQLFEAEVEGEILQGNDKICAHKIRLVRQVEAWNDKTLRLFAVWCALEALKLVENPDPRIVNACDVVEKYANGEATDEELAAAKDAAGAAAKDAAWAAAWAAALATAWAAALAAALDAARAAAWAAAWDAARAAARARDAAWAAAWDAARAAAREKQSKKLIKMLELEVE